MTLIPEPHIISSPYPPSPLTFLNSQTTSPFTLRLPQPALQHSPPSNTTTSDSIYHSHSILSSPDTATMKQTGARQSPPSTPPPLFHDDRDVFKLPPTVALTLLARSIEMLVSFTGDIPPTPPISHPSSPDLSAVDEATLQATHGRTQHIEASPLTSGFTFNTGVSDEVDGVRVKKRTARSYSEPQEPEGKLIAAGVDNAMQYGAITRKFWCKSVPEIPIEDYIFRFVWQ